MAHGGIEINEDGSTPPLPEVSIYHDLKLKFDSTANYKVQMNWIKEKINFAETIDVFVVPKLNDIQLRGAKAERNVKVTGRVGDLIRVTLDENPTTGYITIHNGLKKIKNEESKSLSDKQLAPLESHVIELNNYYSMFVDSKTSYRSGMTGVAGCRVMTFGLLKSGKHTLYIGQARPWEIKEATMDY